MNVNQCSKQVPIPLMGGYLTLKKKTPRLGFEPRNPFGNRIFAGTCFHLFAEQYQTCAR